MAQKFVAFPKDTRTMLAHLELQYERGELTEQEYAAQETACIETARTQLKLGPEWRTDENALARDYTQVPITHPMIKVMEVRTRADGTEYELPVFKADAAPMRFVPTRRTMVFWVNA